MNAPFTQFEFRNQPVRIFPTADGLSFWVVGADLALALGYAEAKDALRTVPGKHIRLQTVATAGGRQQMLCLDEAGMWRLVMRSNKPWAEEFQEWVTAEVLPSVRRTGAYMRQGEQQLPTLEPTTEVSKDEYIDVLKTCIRLLQVTEKAQPRRRNYTPAERAEVLRLRAQGIGPKAIGERLGRSPASIETLVRGSLRNGK